MEARQKEAYELLMGAWHSEDCYRAGANRDPELCTCGLTAALKLLQEADTMDQRKAYTSVWAEVRRLENILIKAGLCLKCGRSNCGHARPLERTNIREVNLGARYRVVLESVLEQSKELILVLSNYVDLLDEG
jgi:hypothetical protein